MPSGWVKVRPEYMRVTLTCGGIITPLELELLLDEDELELEELLLDEELEELLVAPLEEELELEELEELLLDEDELLLELDDELLEDVPPPQPTGVPETTISSIHTSALWALKLCQPNIT
jgi:hypothetical protein